MQHAARSFRRARLASSGVSARGLCTPQDADRARGWAGQGSGRVATSGWLPGGTAASTRPLAEGTITGVVAVRDRCESSQAGNGRPAGGRADRPPGMQPVSSGRLGKQRARSGPSIGGWPGAAAWVDSGAGESGRPRERPGRNGHSTRGGQERPPTSRPTRTAGCRTTGQEQPSHQTTDQERPLIGQPRISHPPGNREPPTPWTTEKQPPPGDRETPTHRGTEKRPPAGQPRNSHPPGH